MSMKKNVSRVSLSWLLSFVSMINMNVGISAMKESSINEGEPFCASIDKSSLCDYSEGEKLALKKLENKHYVHRASPPSDDQQEKIMETIENLFPDQVPRAIIIALDPTENSHPYYPTSLDGEKIESAWYVLVCPSRIKDYESEGNKKMFNKTLEDRELLDLWEMIILAKLSAVDELKDRGIINRDFSSKNWYVHLKYGEFGPNVTVYLINFNSAIEAPIDKDEAVSSEDLKKSLITLIEGLRDDFCYLFNINYNKGQSYYDSFTNCMIRRIDKLIEELNEKKIKMQDFRDMIIGPGKLFSILERMNISKYQEKERIKRMKEHDDGSYQYI